MRNLDQIILFIVHSKLPQGDFQEKTALLRCVQKKQLKINTRVNKIMLWKLLKSSRLMSLKIIMFNNVFLRKLKKILRFFSNTQNIEKILGLEK